MSKDAKDKNRRPKGAKEKKGGKAHKSTAQQCHSKAPKATCSPEDESALKGAPSLKGAPFPKDPPSLEDALSPEFFEARKAELATRVSAKRFAHVMGVVDTADQLARAYGVDTRKARLAALLHDWDKGYSAEQIRERARQLNVDTTVHPDMMGDMTELLHGPTAAAALAAEHPCIPADVLQAVRLHTMGSECMSNLDMIVYVADMLEPGRSFDGLDELRAHAGTVPLDELYLTSFAHVMQHLVESRKLLYTPTVGIWNQCVRRSRAKAAAHQKRALYPASTDRNASHTHKTKPARLASQPHDGTDLACTGERKDER